MSAMKTESSIAHFNSVNLWLMELLVLLPICIFSFSTVSICSLWNFKFLPKKKKKTEIESCPYKTTKLDIHLGLGMEEVSVSALSSLATGLTVITFELPSSLNRPCRIHVLGIGATHSKLCSWIWVSIRITVTRLRKGWPALDRYSEPHWTHKCHAPLEGAAVTTEGKL